MKFIANFLKFTRKLKRLSQLNSWRPFLLAEAISYSVKLSFQLKLYPFQRKPFLLTEAISSSGGHSFQRKSFFLAEAIPLHSFQWKPFPFVKAVCFSGNCFLSFQWKPFLLDETIGVQWEQFLLVETAPFNTWYFLYWKLFLLLEAVHFSGSHSFQFFLQSLCFWWKSMPLVLTSPFRRSLFFLVEAWWKLVLLIETFPLSGSHSFQCFNIFSGRSYQKLHK